MKFLVLVLFLFVFSWTALVMPPGMSKFPKVKVNLQQKSGQVHTIEFDTDVRGKVSNDSK